ncbi:MAG: bifunctional adenosylcobinamide kinase/adenosylcobinamide-phosphate guanylyltransferase [Rhizobacter sp.]|nr:bifunctional adenosylcobinamide kinase/adenosylcobinamide-phosphate guanylyltransferase [Chlorobiales bacterium]
MPAHLIFITGGERSGKSRYAEQLALERSAAPIYIATARKWDDDFSERIETHRATRSAAFRTIEAEKIFSDINADGETLVLDCITLWLTNWFTDLDGDVEKSFAAATAEFELLLQKNCTLITVSNEIGMGVHAATAVGRKFVELQGRVNQFIAARANEVTLMVSGIPVVIKPVTKP